MKTVLERPKSQLVTVMMLSFAVIVSSGLATLREQISLFDDLGHMIRTLPELPGQIVTSLRTFPERMDPTCSECR